jgi:hypothetical protein
VSWLSEVLHIDAFAMVVELSPTLRNMGLKATFDQRCMPPASTNKLSAINIVFLTTPTSRKCFAGRHLCLAGSGTLAVSNRDVTQKRTTQPMRLRNNLDNAWRDYRYFSYQ